MLDTDSKDLVTVHTDGNEQLSVMSYGTGMVITADSVSALCMLSVVFFVRLYFCFLEIHSSVLYKCTAQIHVRGKTSSIIQNKKAKLVSVVGLVVASRKITTVIFPKII